MVALYKHVLLVGATSGIGSAFAEKLVQEGSKVIAVGRREERLQSFVQKHGADRTSYIKFDITDTAGLDSFVNEVLEKYPDLDCVFLNSGVQNPYRLSDPAGVDLDLFHSEVNTNFTSLVNLILKFLPALLKKDYPTSLIVTGTHISLVPALSVPAYSASKAALRAFFDCLRRSNQGSSVKFVDVSPPLVQTEIHDYLGAERGRGMGMPVQEFVEAAYAGLVRGDDVVNVGLPGGASQEDYDALIGARQKIFDNLSNLMASFN